MRLIDADELRKEVISKVKRPTPHTIGSYSFRKIMEIIESQPTVKLKLTVDDMPRYTHNVSVETRWVRALKEVSETLCNSCARQNYCGNNTQKNYCTGYMPYVETRWEADDIKTPPFTQGLKKIIQATERLNEKCNEIDSEVNKWGRKRVCDVDDDM